MMVNTKENTPSDIKADEIKAKDIHTHEFIKSIESL